MATAPRAPFYAPRPSDDPCWQWSPPVASNVILQLAHQKFFGALGQVVTRCWSQFYTYIEPPDWAPTLENLNSSTIPPLSQLGVTKPRDWSQFYTFDDPGVWYPQIDSLTSALIQILDHVPFSNKWPSSYDEGALWQLDINWMSSAPIQILTGNKQPFHYQWSYNFDDASPWAPWINRNQVVLTPIAAPLVNYTWRFNFDDASSWQVTAESLNSSVIQILSSGGKPPISRWQWSYTTDDAATWQWTPPNTITNQLVVYHTSGMSVIGPDDPPVWSWFALPKAIALTTTSPNPFIPRQWTFNLASDEPWQWSVPRAQPLSMLNFQPFSPRFIPTYDEPGWTGALRPVPMTLTFVSRPPFTPLQWGFGYDDSAVWTGQSHNSFFTQHQPIPFVAQMWNLNIPQDTPSSAYSTPAAALTLPAPVGGTLIQRTLTGVGL